jgi:hypothetical protein
MKSTLLFFLLFGLAVSANAQAEQVLPVDDHGKFIYYEVVNANATSKEILHARALAFFKKKNGPTKFLSLKGDSAVLGTGKFVINKTVLVMSHPSGEVLFNCQVETKNDRYRFWLTDFSFIPYQRDRYGNFVASTTIGVPLENNPGKLNAGQWKEYQVQTATFAKNFAIQFKSSMANETKVVNPVVEKKVVTKTW